MFVIFNEHKIKDRLGVNDNKARNKNCKENYKLQCPTSRTVAFQQLSFDVALNRKTECSRKPAISVLCFPQSVCLSRASAGSSSPECLCAEIGF